MKKRTSVQTNSLLKVTAFVGTLPCQQKLTFIHTKQDNLPAGMQ